MQQNNRPRFLTLWQLKLPLPGVVSIIHRLAGVAMVLVLPFLLYLLQLSLSGGEGFDRVAAVVGSWPGRLLGLLLLWLFAHHLFAGIRVMLIDLEWGCGLVMARRTARLVLFSALLMVLMGGML
jgi:succinate dehydrogenase / fumarate reductase cytochrome b subunit